MDMWLSVINDDKYSKPVQIYRGENAVHKFMEKMLEEVEWCKKMKCKHFNKDMILTKDDKQNFKNADKCYIYNKKYSVKGIRVTDHCHITGKYIGSAHQNCNINYRSNDKIPVIFHNLRGYDSQFIMQTIGEIANRHTNKNTAGEEKQMNINLIPNNMEKYMAFMLGKHLVFIDSLQFMSSSLEKLVSSLPNDAFKYIVEEIKNAKKLKLMKQKGVYSYDYMDSFNRFSETKLPTKEDFYSILNEVHICDTLYVHAIKVWNTFS